jgi:hypothetical protein
MIVIDNLETEGAIPLILQQTHRIRELYIGQDQLNGAEFDWLAALSKQPTPILQAFVLQDGEAKEMNSGVVFSPNEDLFFRSTPSLTHLGISFDTFGWTDVTLLRNIQSLELQPDVVSDKLFATLEQIPSLRSLALRLSSPTGSEAGYGGGHISRLPLTTLAISGTSFALGFTIQHFILPSLHELDIHVSDPVKRSDVYNFSKPSANQAWSFFARQLKTRIVDYSDAPVFSSIRSISVSNHQFVAMGATKECCFSVRLERPGDEQWLGEAVPTLFSILKSSRIETWSAAEFQLEDRMINTSRLLSALDKHSAAPHICLEDACTLLTFLASNAEDNGHDSDIPFAGLQTLEVQFLRSEHILQLGRWLQWRRCRGSPVPSLVLRNPQLPQKYFREAYENRVGRMTVTYNQREWCGHFGGW